MLLEMWWTIAQPSTMIQDIFGYSFVYSHTLSNRFATLVRHFPLDIQRIWVKCSNLTKFSPSSAHSCWKIWLHFGFPFMWFTTWTTTRMASCKRMGCKRMATRFSRWRAQWMVIIWGAVALAEKWILYVVRPLQRHHQSNIQWCWQMEYH